MIAANGKEIRIAIIPDEDYSWLCEDLDISEDEYNENPIYDHLCAVCKEPIEARRSTKNSLNDYKIIRVHKPHFWKSKPRISCKLNKGYSMATARLLTYEEYKESYGDANKHEIYAVVLEEKCDHDAWHRMYEFAVWGLDYMIWDITPSCDAYDTPQEITDESARQVAEELVYQYEHDHDKEVAS